MTGANIARMDPTGEPPPLPRPADGLDARSWWDGLNSSAKGRIAQQKVLTRADVKGWTASVTQEGARYDLVLDDGSKLHRIQVKWAGARRQPGVAVVALERWSGNSRDGRREKRRLYSAAEVDAVLAYVPMTDQVCWFGREHLDQTSIRVRHRPTLNGLSRRVIDVERFLW